MWDLLSIENVFFTFLGYPMSHIEFAGTILYLLSVWLMSKRNMLTWPVGIVSVLLYMALFYQIRLYSDTVEQVYYLGASAYGWWFWLKSPRDHQIVTQVEFSRPKALMTSVIITVVATLAAGAFMSRIHEIFPALFPEKASLPWLDALTTVMSFTAMLLMVWRRIESWIYWIIVDVIGIGLYFVKDVKFVALLYGVLLILAIRGYLLWTRAGKVRQRT